MKRWRGASGAERWSLAIYTDGDTHEISVFVTNDQDAALGSPTIQQAREIAGELQRVASEMERARYARALEQERK